MELNLLNKTELWIHQIRLNQVNLTELAECVAEVLSLEKKDVLVVDVRPDCITFDILTQNIALENIIGKEKSILQALSFMKGVNVSEQTYIHSDGILGVICLQEENTAEIIGTIDTIGREISENVARRVIVFPTGFEVMQGMIKDTNSPYLQELFTESGYKVIIGPVIEDDLSVYAFQLSDALSSGYGLIITTGGVGAEDKDKSVEAVLQADPQAAVEYIVKFQQGSGRHVKDGVRICVGQVGPSLIVTLPGPHDEVRIAAPVLLECLQNKDSKEITAKKLADVLARKLLQKRQEHWHNH